MNTTCHVHNRVTLKSGTTTTLYEMWKGRKPTVKYFHVFRSKCYILADREHRRKMDPKIDEGIFLGFSANSRAYRVFNSRTKVVMEAINVVIDDISVDRVPNVEPDVRTSIQEINAPTQVNESKSEKGESEQAKQDHVSTSKGSSIGVQKNYPQDLIIWNPDQGIPTRRSNEVISNSCFMSKLEPKNVKEALTDELWIEQCKRN
jgi:hypothetical protein